MNSPQLATPPVKRRVPALAIVLFVLFVLCGVLAFGWHMLAGAFTAATGDEVTVNELAVNTTHAPVAVLPDALTERLDRVEQMLRELSAKISGSIDAQTAMQRDLALIRDRLDREAAERGAAAKPAVAQRTALRQRRIVKATPPPAPVAAPSASVLSVDTWGGKPSVAIRGPDGRVQFANTGDRVPGGVLGSAQVVGQTVTIRHGDGTVSTVTTKDR